MSIDLKKDVLEARPRRNFALPLSISSVLIVAMLAIFGIVTSQNNTQDLNDTVKTLNLTSKLYINEDTNKITKFVDAYQYVVFEEGYTSSDVLIETHAETFVFGTGSLNGTIEVDGGVSEVPTRIIWQYTNPLEMVTFFNDNIANESFDSVKELKAMPFNELVSVYISSVVKGAIDSGVLPSVQYTLKPQVTRFTNAAVAAAEANGMSAEDAYKQFHGKPQHDGVTSYEYEHSCTHYIPSMDGQAVADAAQALFAPDEVNHFLVELMSSTVTSETPAACDVVAVYNLPAPPPEPGAPSPRDPAREVVLPPTAPPKDDSYNPPTPPAPANPGDQPKVK